MEERNRGGKKARNKEINLEIRVSEIVRLWQVPRLDRKKSYTEYRSG